ncbi:hypothetical protein Q9L58_005519 [Maublancomyces gigas]|uniref:Uncharacterized protein n=1 Tax=Discina gigas TaxID=1032678 RepID=A0ABR3GIC0_9PEZI
MNTQDPGSSDGIDPDPQSCVPDVLLDLSVISTRFILALQSIELSLRQRKAVGEEAVDGEAVEEIKLRVAGHIDDIQALCDRISPNPQEGTVYPYA